MRTFVIAALAAASLGLGAASPANATYWACMGDHVACGDATPAKTYKQAAPKAAYKAPKKAYKAASYDSDYAPKPKKQKPTYSGGGGGYSAGGGMASYYWQPQKVASGGWFNPNAMTAAHKTLPFGTKVRVTNKHNGRSVVVTINDRGPYVAGRVIDLSKAAAGVIGMQAAGVVPVSIAVLGR